MITCRLLPEDKRVRVLLYRVGRRGTEIFINNEITAKTAVSFKAFPLCINLLRINPVKIMTVAVIMLKTSHSL